MSIDGPSWRARQRYGGGPGALDTTLSVGKFIYTNFDPVPATTGQVFASITGVYTEHTVFQLLPRTRADLE